MTSAARPFARRTSTLLAALLLAACGGGDADTPAPPVGSGPAQPPDTTAPTITITSGASAAAATGPVTFTFTFSEDVVVSFGVDDVVVTGGTKGAFTRVSGTQATLVVVPPAGATGMIDVSVAAGKFSDIAGNANTAAAAAQRAFDTPAPVVGGGGSVPGYPITFDDAALTYTLTGFGGAEDSTVVSGVAGATGKVARVVKSATAELWAGTTVSTGANASIATIPFTATAKSMTLRAWTPAAGIPVRLKVEDAADSTHSVETEALTTVAGGWETLTFDFANQVSGTAALNLAFTYNKASVFFNFGKTGAAGGAGTYYFDDLNFVAAAGGGGGGGGVACGTTAPTCAPATTIPAGSTVIYSDAVTVAGIVKKPDWQQSPPVVFSEPVIAGNASLKYTFSAGALYEGIDWTASPQNVSSKGTLHVDVWTADVATVKVTLIGGGGENGITKPLTAGSWNSIDIPLNQYTSPDLTKIIQMKLEPNAAGTIYVDNIYFHGTAAGGGGGGGTFAGGIFSSDYSGNLGAGTAKSDKNGTVGFFLDPRLFANKAFEDGSVCGSACNPGGVYNFYYGIGKLPPVLTDAYFGGFVNAPGNTTADASAFAKIKLKFWGDAESWEKPNFTAQVDVIVQGPANAACTNASGRPEIIKAVTAQKIGAGSDYVIPKTDFVLSESCGGAYTVNSVWSAIGAVVVRLSGTNLQYVNSVASNPVSFPTFINIGPISFIN